MDININDHFDFKRLNLVLESFNQATGFVTAILDLKGNVLSKSGWREVCTDFHRINNETKQACKKSDTLLASKMGEGENYHAYSCLNGLVDVVVPIIINEKHFANLFTGQFFFTEPSLDFFKKQAVKYNFDKNSYLRAVKKVPVVSEAKVQKIMKVLVQIIEMISDLTVEKMEQEKLNNLLKLSYRELKISQEKLKKEKENLKITLNSIGDAVISTDINGLIVQMNPVAEKLTGWKRKSAIGKPIQKVFNIINKKTKKKVKNPAAKVLAQGKTVGLANHTVLIAKDGSQYQISDSAAPIIDAQNNIIGVVLVFRNITEKYQMQEKLKYRTFHDELTGLYNRAYFNEEIKRYNNERQLPLSVIMGDINGLKIANDSFGHQQGDRLLKKIAQIIKDCCRREDLVARTGGDEFVILLPQTSKKEAVEIYERIKTACQNAKADPIELSIALGIASKKEMTTDFEKVLKKAEDKMYQNKVHESKSVHNTILASLETMLRETTNETLEHSQRLNSLAVSLGKKLSLSRHQLDVLASLANLHDLGKITISKKILQKPGSLTDQEWKEIKRHPEAGYKIAKSSPKLNEVAEGVLCHHERWDGDGYPQGLAEEEIPLLARIITIVDAYDVMTNNRPYKKAMNKEKALIEIKNCSGSQFDPKLVKIFIKMMNLSH